MQINIRMRRSSWENGACACFMNVHLHAVKIYKRARGPIRVQTLAFVWPPRVALMSIARLSDDSCQLSWTLGLVWPPRVALTSGTTPINIRVWPRARELNKTCIQISYNSRGCLTKSFCLFHACARTAGITKQKKGNVSFVFYVSYMFTLGVSTCVLVS